jgi:hypothetical protein
VIRIGVDIDADSTAEREALVAAARAVYARLPGRAWAITRIAGAGEEENGKSGKGETHDGDDGLTREERRGSS